MGEGRGATGKLHYPHSLGLPHSPTPPRHSPHSLVFTLRLQLALDQQEAGVEVFGV